MTDIPYTNETVRDGGQPERDPRFLEPTRERILRVWWAFFWPKLIAMVAIALAGSRLENWIASLNYLSSGQLKFAVSLAEIWFWSTLMLGAMDYALGRSFANFRVALVPATGGDVTPLRRTFARVARVAWGYLWRVWLLELFLGLVALFFLPALHAFSNLSSYTVGILDLFLSVAATAALGLYVFRDSIVGQVFGDARVVLLPPR